MKSKPKSKAKLKKSIKKEAKKINRDFGVPLDREFGKYLQKRGLPALAEILKVDK
jgi:hypothetical protein